MSLIEKSGSTPTPSFEEQMRQAEAEAGNVPPDSELYAEFGVEYPEPDERGQIPASRSVEAEAEAPAETEPPQDEAGAESETVEAVEPQAEVPDKLEELNKKLGQLLNENAELRKTISEPAQEHQQQYQQQYQVPLTQETVNYLDELAVENPQQAVVMAAQTGQPILYDRALRSWYDQDPVAAARYERQIEYAQLEQRLAGQIQPQLASATQIAEEQQLAQAFKNVADRHEDFHEVIGTLNDERSKEIIDQGLPRGILTDLQGNQQAKEQVFEAIYRWVKADLGDSFKAAAAEATAAKAEENKQAKREATVASATTTTPESVPETEEERLIRVWKEQSPSMQSAWTGRSAR